MCLTAKTLLPQHGPDRFHPATLQHNLVALGQQAWPQRGTTRKKEAKTKWKKKRGDSAAAFFKSHPSHTKLTWPYGLAITIVHFQPHQQAGTAPRMSSHIQDGFNFMRWDEQGFPQS